ncbi:hypothetical protein CTAYLR_005489 [Chrysophaeum taylorii]|uniref:Nucleoside-diphosphate kinase n=1 Tax=Chrysophaeum taylorii TaxID=2483200 RepID=A0AAD7U4Q2_9STRA|nr:hypothetical protein CTAYLR_005489 [Chrysophaeum taylorii]
MFVRAAMPTLGRVAPVAVASSLTLATCAQTEGESSTKALYAVALGAGAAAAGALYASSTRCASIEDRIGALEVKAAQKESSAFVFVKPHAVTDPVKALVKEKLCAAGVSVVSEGDIPGPVIDEKMYIDNHYGAIAEKAVVLKPAQLSPSSKAIAEFEKTFGIAWSDALAKGLVFNARDACAKLGIDGDDLDKKWSTLKRGVTLIKFGGGFYCGRVDGLFVINGFYMSMRGKFTKPDASIHYYLVEWPTASLSWEDFRGKVLGGTNPHEAAPGSLRKLIADDWKKLGLSAVPDTGDNGVHASASPFEALAERMNWTGAALDADTYGKGLLAAGVPAKTIANWTSDPVVNLPGGAKGSLFDALEDLDSNECLAKAVSLAKLNPPK